MNTVQYGAKLAYEAQNNMPKLNMEERYNKIYEEHPDFTKTFPLVVKYFCMGYFDENLFKNLVEQQEREKTGFAKSLEIQGDYIKFLLIAKRKMSRIDAKKISNLEKAQVEMQFNQLRRQTENLKKVYKMEEKDAVRIRRKELEEFVMELEN